jgi:protein-disulfide isomerase
MDEDNNQGKGSASDTGTVTFKKTTLWKVGTFVFAALFILSFLGGFDGFRDGGGTGTGSAVAPTNPIAPTANVKVQIEDNDPVLGELDAGITIVEFSDFQCPFCERAYSGAVADLKNSDEFKNGDVNLIYKHFPLNSIHPQAQKAAEAAECANRQGEFWAYHDTLFTNQNALDIASLKSYAGQVGLDTNAFNACLDGDDARSEVNKETAQATAAGGRGTPYFVIINNDNGDTVPVSGAVPWANFQSAISSVQ